MSATSAHAWLFALACLVLPAQASAACYQLFDKDNKLVLRSTTPPVDTSRSYSEEVERRFPGHFLVVGGDGPCPEVDEFRRAVKLPEPLNRGPVRVGPDATPRPTVASGSPYRPPSSTRAGIGSVGAVDPACGDDVGVKSYTRKDGTVVRAHKRGCPGSGSKR